MTEKRTNKRIIVVASMQAYILDEYNGGLDELASNAIRGDFAKDIISSPESYIVFQADGTVVEHLLNQGDVSLGTITLRQTNNRQVCPHCIKQEVVTLLHDYNRGALDEEDDE